MELIYEGKSKKVYRKDAVYLLEFKDEVTAGDGARRDAAPGKGRLAAELSALLFRHVEAEGVPTHFIEYMPPRTIAVKPAKVAPVEVIVRFKAYGSYLKRVPTQPLKPFSKPLVEFHYKDDKLHDPLVLEEDVVEAGLADAEQVRLMKKYAVAAAEALRRLYQKADCDFVDVKFEFGVVENGGLVLVDEISGDTFRLLCNGEHLDKEYYRKTGDVEGLLRRYETLLNLTRNLLRKS
ncbi:MAG: phosphoribosylaminoimidazolesuccinocarboxamide synthase [Pyrobaculum sp.]